MKIPLCLFAVMMTAATVPADHAVRPFNNLGCGTLSGRLQSLSMYRDFDNGNNAWSSTLGLKLDYRAPELEGWSAGLGYTGAGVLDSMDYGSSPDPGDALVANGRVNVLNEAYISYNMQAFGLTNTTATAGRRINNAEVFRADDFRQKARSISAVQADSRDLENVRIAGGHAFRMSNWIDAGDRWDFNNFGDVFGTGYDTDGITWIEGSYVTMDRLEIALFDAVAWDAANLIGGRARYRVSDETALLGYLRNESDIGRADDHEANVFGLALEQMLGGIRLEGGYFGIAGDNLLFQETTTGINHALGTSMMIYAQQFNGGSDTLYAKAATHLEKSRTTLCGLYNSTFHDTGKTGAIQRHGHELNLILKQPVPKIDNVEVALKLGAAWRDGINGMDDTFATDTRLFFTYLF